MGTRLTKEKRSCLVQVYPSVLATHAFPFYTVSLHIYHGSRHIDLLFLHSVFYICLVHRCPCQSEGESYLLLNRSLSIRFQTGHSVIPYTRSVSVDSELLRVRISPKVSLGGMEKLPKQTIPIFKYVVFISNTSKRQEKNVSPPHQYDGFLPLIFLTPSSRVKQT